MEIVKLTQWSDKLPDIQLNCSVITNGFQKLNPGSKVNEVVKANCYAKNLGCKMGR